MAVDWRQDPKLAIIRQYSGKSENILSLLLDLQEAAPGKCIDSETAALVARELRLTETRVYEIMAFYALLHTEPQARYIFEICASTPCYFSKSSWVAGVLAEELGIAPGERTADGRFAVRYIPCVGACAIGPVIKVGDRIYGNLTEPSIRNLVASFRNESMNQEHGYEKN